VLRLVFGDSKEYDDPVLRQNLKANIVDGAMFAFGMSLVSLQTVFPVFLKRVGGSNIAVGLIPVLWTAGLQLPQILVANQVQWYARKRELFLRTALVQRIPWILLAILSLFVIERVSPLAGTVLLLLFLLVAAVAGSINFPIWFDLLAKLTPMKLRGRLFAARNLLGAALAVVGGIIVEWVLANVAYPTSYGLLFLMAVAAMFVSYASLCRLRELQDSPVGGRKTVSEYARELPRIVLRNRNFRNFLISDGLLTAATMAGAFYAVNAIERFALDDSSVGMFTMVMAGTLVVGNLVFGRLADRTGHKTTLVCAAGATTVAATTALVAPSATLYLVVFGCAALQVSLSGISRLPLVAELCPEKDRPTYVALTNMVSSPFALFGIVAGYVASRIGYEPVFLLAAVFSALSVFWLLRFVVDPRAADAGPALAVSSAETSATKGTAHS
jgi:MFS family permease